MIKKILLAFSILAVIIFSFFLAKDLIFKSLLERYLYNNFQAQSSFEKINLNLKCFDAHGVSLLKNQDYFSADKVRLCFNLFSLGDPQTYGLEIKGADFNIQDSARGNFNLIPGEEKHFLEMKGLEVFKKKIEKLFLSLYLAEGSLYFQDLESDLFSAQPDISGQFDFLGREEICGHIVLEKLPLEDLIFLFADKKEGLEASGKFSGRVNFCFDQGEVSYLGGGIEAVGGGMLNIKQEAPIDFLRKRLDKKSYQYLIDSLKKYKYDKGSITLTKEEGIVSVQVSFDSQLLGVNLDINFH